MPFFFSLMPPRRSSSPIPPAAFSARAFAAFHPPYHLPAAICLPCPPTTFIYTPVLLPPTPTCTHLPFIMYVPCLHHLYFSVPFLWFLLAAPSCHRAFLLYPHGPPTRTTTCARSFLPHALLPLPHGSFRFLLILFAPLLPRRCYLCPPALYRSYTRLPACLCLATHTLLFAVCCTTLPVPGCMQLTFSYPLFHSSTSFLRLYYIFAFSSFVLFHLYLYYTTTCIFLIPPMYFCFFYAGSYYHTPYLPFAHIPAPLPYPYYDAFLFLIFLIYMPFPPARARILLLPMYLPYLLHLRPHAFTPLFLPAFLFCLHLPLFYHLFLFATAASPAVLLHRAVHRPCPAAPLHFRAVAFSTTFCRPRPACPASRCLLSRAARPRRRARAFPVLPGFCRACPARTLLPRCRCLMPHPCRPACPIPWPALPTRGAPRASTHLHAFSRAARPLLPPFPATTTILQVLPTAGPAPHASHHTAFLHYLPALPVPGSFGFYLAVRPWLHLHLYIFRT